MSITHLYMPIEGSMVETGAADPVRYIDVGEQGDEVLGTAYSIISGGYVQRGLPVLVPRVHVCTVSQQDLHGVLGSRGEGGGSLH